MYSTRILTWPGATLSNRNRPCWSVSVRRVVPPTNTFADTTGCRDVESVTRPVTAVCCASAVLAPASSAASASAPTRCRMSTRSMVPSHLSSKGCVDDSNDDCERYRCCRSTPGYIAENGNVGRDSEYTGQKKRSCATLLCGTRQQPAVAGTAPHDGRPTKLQTRSHQQRDIVRKVRSYNANSAPRWTASQGHQGAFTMSGIGEEKRGRTLARAPFRSAAPDVLLGEIHPRRLGRVGTRQIEVRPRLPAGELGRQQLRKAPDIGVVAVHGVIVVLTRHRDAILRSLELVLQRAEVLVRLELRIVLRDGDEPPQRRRQRAVGVGHLLQVARLHRPGEFRAGVRDRDEDGLLLFGVAPDR